MAHIAEGAGLRPAHSTGWLSGLRAGLRRRLLERRTRNDLMALSDRELDDLGLTRGQIPEVARRAAETA